MSCQNSNRKSKIVRPRIDEEAYLTLCSWVGKSTSAKIMVADKVIEAQNWKIKTMKSRSDSDFERIESMIDEVDSLNAEIYRHEENAKSWKSSFLTLLSINIASFVFWLLAK